MCERLYHVTHPDNVKQIQRSGLKANADGVIYLFTDPVVAEEIGKNQTFIRPDYALFEIDPAGIKCVLEADDVAEFAAVLHRVARQPRIAPKHLTFKGISRVGDGPTEFEYRKMESLGMDRKSVDEQYEILRWYKEEIAKGRDSDEVREEANQRLPASIRRMKRRVARARKRANEPLPEPCFAPASEIECPTSRPRSASLVGKFLTNRRSAPSSREVYHLSTNRPRKHWILWLHTDDEAGSTAVVSCRRARVHKEVAATLLLGNYWKLLHAWDGTLNRSIVEGGVLSTDQLTELQDTCRKATRGKRRRRGQSSRRKRRTPG